MGIDAQYKIRFASEEAARAAIQNMGGVAKYQAIGRENHYEIRNSFVELTARPSWEDKAVVVVSSLHRYFPWGERVKSEDSEEKRDRAPGVLIDLEQLLMIRALDGETIHYGSDLADEEELGEPVTRDFMEGLREFVGIRF